MMGFFRDCVVRSARIMAVGMIYPPSACFAALAIILLSVASPAAWTQTFRTYVNQRFGAAAEVPAAWKADPPPENRDGLAFRSPDGHASIIVSGSLHVLDTVEEEMRLYEQPAPGEKITFRRRGPHFLVVSGARGDMIFYAKHLLSCGDRVWNNLWIEYPAREKAAYDTLVARVSRSFRPGRSEQVEECNS